jgi:hypothetical protein
MEDISAIGSSINLTDYVHRTLDILTILAWEDGKSSLSCDSVEPDIMTKILRLSAAL